MKQIRVVAALIVDPRDPSRFLVQQRLPDKARANLWEFPGGKVEPGETDEAALVRECREELAVELTVGRRLWGNTHEYSDLIVQLGTATKAQQLELFAAQIREGEPKPLGAQALRFCTPTEMQLLPFCEADLPLLESLVSGAVSTR